MFEESMKDKVEGLRVPRIDAKWALKQKCELHDDSMDLDENASPARRRIALLGDEAEALLGDIHRRWELGDEEEAAILEMSKPEFFSETEDYWNTLRLFYPTVFTEGNAEEVADFTQTSFEDNIAPLRGMRDHANQGDYSQIQIPHDDEVLEPVSGPYPNRDSLRGDFEFSPQPFFPVELKYHIVAIIHALIPPIWMAAMHPDSFTLEFWRFDADGVVNVGSEPESIAWHGKVLRQWPRFDTKLFGWTPEKAVVFIVVVSVVASYVVAFNFLKYLDGLTLEFQNQCKKLVIFRATTEFGFGTLDQQWQDRFLHIDGADAKHLRVSVQFTASELQALERFNGVNFVKDLKAKRRKYASSLDAPNTYPLAPYHLAPSRFFRPIRVCLWWKVRHCLKVSIEGKKVDIELMLSLVFVMFAILGINALLMIFVHEKLTVLSILSLYDLVVLNVFIIPMINACVYMGEFLKSDAHFLNLVKSQIVVSEDFGLQTPDREHELKICKTLVDYFKLKIETHEMGPQIFGLNLTPELRSKLVTLGAVGLGGTAGKAAKYYLRKMLNKDKKAEVVEGAVSNPKTADNTTKGLTGRLRRLRDNLPRPPLDGLLSSVVFAGSSTFSLTSPLGLGAVWQASAPSLQFPKNFVT